MGICSNCKKSIPDGSAFCPYCRTKSTDAKKTCSKCGKTIKKAAKFCAYCGSKTEKVNRCVNCKTPLEDDILFCPECGLRRYVEDTITEPIGELLYQSSLFSVPGSKSGTLSVYDNKITFRTPTGLRNDLPIREILNASENGTVLFLYTESGKTYQYTAFKEEAVFLNYLVNLIRDCIRLDVNLGGDNLSDTKTLKLTLKKKGVVHK